MIKRKLKPESQSKFETEECEHKDYCEEKKNGYSPDFDLFVQTCSNCGAMRERKTDFSAWRKND